jgi:hypothetical protein
MNKYKKIDLLQKKFEKLDPTADQRTIYARMYGTLSARITDKQVDEMLADHGIEIPEEKNV